MNLVGKDRPLSQDTRLTRENSAEGNETEEGTPKKHELACDRQFIQKSPRSKGTTTLAPTNGRPLRKKKRRQQFANNVLSSSLEKGKLAFHENTDVNIKS